MGTGSPPSRSLRGTWLPTWLRRDGVPDYELVEVQQLGERVLLRILEFPGFDGDLYRPWVASRVTYPLRSMLLQASRNTRGAVLLNLIIVAGGFATSGIAVATKSSGKSSTVPWVIFAVGLIVALGGAITQFFRPAFRATERTALAVELREEGWAFATSSAGYGGAVEQVFPTFEAKVSDIHRRAAKVSALDATASSANASARGARARAGGRGRQQPKPPDAGDAA